jgi:dTDP-4-dehydrorhamnose reductase/adenine/guanine phosphoribosyltransferase-like PRPP-binding protein
LKILIIGASSCLGQKLIEYYSPRNKTLGTFFSSAINSYTYKNIVHLDIERFQVTEKFILDYKPEVVIYLSQFKAKSSDPEKINKEYNINCNALKNVASICSTLGIKIIYQSTDHVLDPSVQGSQSESAVPNPQNSFAQSKLDAEIFLTEHIPNHLILRTPYIYGHSLNKKEHDFFQKLLSAVKSKTSFSVDNSIKRQLVLSDDVAKIIDLLIKHDEKGMFHIAPKQALTSYEFSLLLAKEFTDDTSFIKPIEENSGNLSRQPLLECMNLKKMPVLHSLCLVEEGVKIFKRQFGCSFRMIYSVRPDMLVANQNASDFRISIGKQLAREAPLPADIDHVIPIPESGIYSATGFSAESKIPLFFGIIRDYFTEKTLYSSTTSNRYEKLKRKLIPIQSLIENKKIALVDEAVLSGSTLKVMVQILRDVGVQEIHIRIPSPIISDECTGRVLPRVNLLYPQLSKKGHSLKQNEYEEILESEFNVESFKFLTLDGFRKSFQNQSFFCTECFLEKPRI